MSLRNKAETKDLRAMRELSGLSRKALAEAVGYSERQISRWESGVSEPRLAVLQYLLQLQPKPPNSGLNLTFIDLFAGIGGFRRGFESVGARCVFTSEWDPYAQKTYKANFGEERLAGDVRAVTSDEIPDHDVLLAGFPCQPFSIAGVSKKNSLGRSHGFDCNTQGTLFFEIERIIKAKQPKAFVLENVRNLLSHDRGQTFAVIRDTLESKLGYSLSWKVLDAKAVLPQHRERIFIVGVHSDLNRTFDFEKLDLPAVGKGPRLKSILHPEDGTELPTAYTDDFGRVLSKYTLSEHLWRYLQNYASKHAAKGNGFGFGLVGPDDIARTLSARYYKDGSEILVRTKTGSPRRLTPRECSRLMGFDAPSGEFKIVVSDTQAYKQFGNAVAPPVVASVARALVRTLAAPAEQTVAA